MNNNIFSILLLIVISFTLGWIISKPVHQRAYIEDVLKPRMTYLFDKGYITYDSTEIGEISTIIKAFGK